MRMLIKSIISCILLISANISWAAPVPDSNWYQVNLIIFSHINPQTLNAETWHTVTTLPHFTTAQLPQLLDPTQSALLPELSKLQRSSNYRVLVTASWLQYIPDDTYQKQPTLIQSTDMIDNNYELQGTIAISRQRFFNVKFNLLLTESHNYLDSIAKAAYAPSLQNEPYVAFQLLQSRRTKSGQLNYLDHPLFGALLKITKAEPPLQETS